MFELSCCENQSLPETNKSLKMKEYLNSTSSENQALLEINKLENVKQIAFYCFRSKMMNETIVYNTMCFSITGREHFGLHASYEFSRQTKRLAFYSLHSIYFIISSKSLKVKGCVDIKLVCSCQLWLL
jgi:hypothetical protein